MMSSRINKLSANRNLLKNLVLRDLRHRYAGSLGGFMWSVIHPVVLLISYTFVFAIVLGYRPGADAGTDSFPLFLFCGILPWLLFADTIVRNCSAITDNAQLITKTIIPAEILPVAITISNLVHHVIGLSILAIVLIANYGIHLSAFWILLYMPILLMLAQGIGWIVAGLHVFIRDTIQALQILMFLWFCFTPVLYSMDMLPEEFRFLTHVNPMAVIVTGYRSALLNLPQPAAPEIGIVMLISAATFLLGAFFFRKAKPAFPEVL